MKRPQPHEYGIFYKTYIDTVSDNLMNELEAQAKDLPLFIRSIPADKADFAYADGKWTVKELLGHILDTERIMAYRALRIARNDKTPLPGFEENEYVENAHFSDRDLESFAKEFELLRGANMILFSSFTDEELSRTGTASNLDISARALLFICAGHLNHHRKILTERYL